MLIAVAVGGVAVGGVAVAGRGNEQAIMEKPGLTRPYPRPPLPMSALAIEALAERLGMWHNCHRMAAVLSGKRTRKLGAGSSEMGNKRNTRCI